MSEGFLGRWSRRKQEATQPPVQPASDGLGAQPPVPPPHQAPVAHPSPEPVAELPTLDDAQALTPASDFQPFMQRGVDAQVRNAAMKKLFADPHFNVMDGLDIYIDDYNQPDPLPTGMLRRMASAQFMKLVPEEAPAGAAQDPAAQCEPPVVAQSPLVALKAPEHDHPDLQLQPDPAAADPQPGPSAR